MRKWAVILFAAVIAAGPAYAGKRALVIGIEQYRIGKYNTIKGCVNDARAVKSVLMDYLQFSEGEIRLMLNQEATRANITGAIEQWLINGTKTGDNVFFYYAGHGFHIPDDNGDEADESPPFDETLCPYDTDPGLFHDRTRKGNMIIDDEIGEYLAKLGGRKVMMIFDSCNSGTVTRSAAMNAPKLAYRSLPVLSERTRGVGGIAQDKQKVHALSEEIDSSESYMAFLSAAGPLEEAKEIVVDGSAHGALTLSLIHAFRQKGGETAMTDITAMFEQIKKRYGVYHQTPRIEGNPELADMPANQFFSASSAQNMASAARYDNKDIGLSLWAASSPGRNSKTVFKLKDNIVFYLRSNTDGYLYLFDIIKKSDELLMIYPNQWSKMRNPNDCNRISKHQEVRIPPDKVHGVPVNFDFTADQRGEETILAILTRTPWTEMDAAVGQTEGPVKVITEAQKSRILELLQRRQAKRHVEYQAGRGEAADIASWAGAVLNIRVE